MTGYGTIFTYSFDMEPSVSQGIIPAPVYRVSFAKRGYTGTSAGILAPYGNPYTKETEGSSDSRFQSLLPQKATFNLLCENQWNAASFYVSDDRELLVTVDVDYTGTTTAYEPHFTGWVLPTDQKEPYGPKPYIISVSATCGLATLKEIPFLDESGKRLTGFVSVAQALRIALFNTGITSQLTTSFGYYSSNDLAADQLVSGHADPNRDPLYQSLMLAETYIGDDGSPLSCWDVLQKVLIHRLRLCQLQGAWWAIDADSVVGTFNPADLTGTTIRTHSYTGTTLSAAPSAHASVDLHLFTDPAGALPVSEGSTYTTPIVQAVRVEQVFGRTLSAIPNGDFAQVDGTMLPTGFVVNNLSDANRGRVGTGTNADPYALRIYDCGDEKINKDTPFVAVSISFNPASKQYTKFQKRQLKFKAKLNNLQAAKAFVTVQRDDGPYIYIKSGFFPSNKVKIKDSVATLFYNNYTDIPTNHKKAKTGLFDCTLDLGEIDKVSKLVIYLCMGECLDFPDANNRPYVEYSDLQLTSAEKGLVLNGTQQTIARPGKTVKQPAKTLTLADAPDAADPYNRVNTLFTRGISSIPVTPGLWYRPDADITAVSPQPKDKGRTLLTLATESEARQTMFPAVRFDGTLRGILRHELHTVLHLSDVGTPAYPLQLASLRSDYRTGEHEVVAVQMLLDSDLTGLTPKRHYQTPDGLIDIAGDDDTKPGDAGAGYVSNKEKLIAGLVDIGAVILKPHPTRDLSGFTASSPGGYKFGATVYSNGVKIGAAKAAFRRNPLFKFPF